jgi:tetratricopeptide (TPR) repeat protein/tRNA A-37 threonylcarbamoyl transferase component Bud32
MWPPGQIPDAEPAGPSSSGHDPAAGYRDEPTTDGCVRPDDMIRRDVGSPGTGGSAVDAASAGRARSLTDAETVFRPPPSSKLPAERARPRRIGTYEIMSVIDVGGMGVVYKARHVALDRVVALKMIRTADLASPRELARFLEEARVVAQFNHDAIVKILDFGEDKGDPYFSMVYVDGGTLQELLSKGPLEPRAAARMIERVADAIAYAHDRGIIHRDLKPSNILLDGNGGPVVSDFGLAKGCGSAADRTLAGQVLGTPSYMPPEQARGEIAAIGPHSDIYATGALLYHAICGRPPFQAATSVETLRQVIDDEPVAPRQLNAAVDRDLETIVLRCIQKQPSSRYASEADLAADLAAYCDGRPIAARPVPALERAWKWGRRHPALASLGCVSAAALVGFGVAGFYRAEAATQRARLAEIEMQARAELAETRDGVSAAMERCRALLDTDNPQEARVVIAGALARIEGNAGLRREQARAVEALAEVDARLATKAELAETQQRLDEFQRRRDSALFHGLQSFGLDPRRNQAIAAAEAGTALALVGLGDEPDGTGPALSATSAELRGATADMRSQCHELLLVRAEARLRAEATPSPDDLARSLADVDRAAAVLGRETQAGRLQRGDYLEAQGDAVAAGRERQIAAEQGPLDVASDHFLVGNRLASRTVVAAADLSRAADAFERALLLDPGHFWAQYGLGSVELRRKRPDLAEVHLTACIGRRPDFAWAWILRGAARLAQQEYDLAEQDLARAIAIEPEGEALHVATQQLGVVAFSRGDTAAARRLLRQAADQSPEAFQPFVSLATIESHDGDAAEAIRLLDEAARRAPLVALVPRERARIRAAQGDFVAAELDFREAARLEEADPAARADDLCLVGEMIFRQGRPSEAIGAWEMAIDIDAEHSRSHLWRAMALVETQQFSEALPSFEAALRTGAPSLELHLTRGLCRASLGDYAAAIDDYSRAIAIAPTAATYTQRGWLYALRGSPLFGLQDFDKALSLEPQNADAHCGRGLTLAYLGRHAEATDAAERSLDLGEPGFRHAYKVAAVFAAAAPRVVLSAQERKAQGPSVGQLRVRYLARACELVEHALTHEGGDDHDDLWLTHVENDPHFQPLLAEPEFRRLRERVMAGETPGRDTSARTAAEGSGAARVTTTEGRP